MYDSFIKLIYGLLFKVCLVQLNIGVSNSHLPLSLPWVTPYFPCARVAAEAHQKSDKTHGSSAALCQKMV
jgi:hypothetical protein